MAYRRSLEQMELPGMEVAPQFRQARNLMLYVLREVEGLSYVAIAHMHRLSLQRTRNLIARVQSQRSWHRYRNSHVPDCDTLGSFIGSFSFATHDELLTAYQQFLRTFVYAEQDNAGTF